jgi:hypothetical protein
MKTPSLSFRLPLLLLALAAAPALTAAGPHAYPPELTRKIDQIRAQIQAQGGQFQVGLNPAMQYDRERLCGTRASAAAAGPSPPSARSKARP